MSNIVFLFFQKGLKNVFDEAILAALEPPEPVRRRRCIVLQKAFNIVFKIYQRCSNNDCVSLSYGAYENTSTNDSSSNYWYDLSFVFISFDSQKQKIKTSILYIKDMHTLYTRTLRVYMCTCTYMHMYKSINTKYIYMLACVLSHLCIHTFIRL